MVSIYSIRENKNKLIVNYCTSIFLLKTEKLNSLLLNLYIYYIQSKGVTFKCITLSNTSICPRTYVIAIS